MSACSQVLPDGATSLRELHPVRSHAAVGLLGWTLGTIPSPKEKSGIGTAAWGRGGLAVLLKERGDVALPDAVSGRWWGSGLGIFKVFSGLGTHGRLGTQRVGDTEPSHAQTRRVGGDW